MRASRGGDWLPGRLAGLWAKEEGGTGPGRGGRAAVAALRALPRTGHRTEGLRTRCPARRELLGRAGSRMAP